MGIEPLNGTVKVENDRRGYCCISKSTEQASNFFKYQFTFALFSPYRCLLMDGMWYNKSASNTI